MSINKKAKVLKAMHTILREYKEKTHNTTTDDCKLCVSFLKKTGKYYFGDIHVCRLCPMFAFGKNGFPCLIRKCAPIDCEGFYYTGELEAVIEFYELAIKKIESIDNAELIKKDGFKFLVNIDKKVAKKYKSIEII
jgi:hypothetical protein